MQPRPVTRPAARLFAWLAPLLIAGFWAAAGRAEPIDTQAEEAILIDLTTGTVLFEKNADARMPTSSMSKIMTAYMVFEALRDGRLHMDDALPVSEHAWSQGGSSMFLDLGSRVPVSELIQGVIVQSGNDASIVLAEALSGSEAAFAEQMNDKIAEWGVSHTHFANATGWPDPDHYSTPRDMATIAAHLISDFPDQYHYYSQLEYTWNGIRQQNRNPLLRLGIGVDGMKTGHTEDAGYGLIASALRNGRRLLLVINGLPSERARAEESERLVEWGYREFDSFEAFQAGEVVDTAKVWMGVSDQVPLVVPQDLWITVRRSERDQLKAVVRLAEPIPAPITSGQQVASLVITAPDMPERTVALVAGTAIERRGFFGRVVGGAEHYLLGAD